MEACGFIDLLTSVLQALLWGVLDGLQQEKAEYAVAAQPGGQAVPLSTVQSVRRTALLQHDAQQEELEDQEHQQIHRHARTKTQVVAAKPTVSTRTHPLDLRALRLIARLGRNVFLGRCAALLAEPAWWHVASDQRRHT